MPQIIYIEHDDTRHVLDVPEGHTLMEGAARNGVPGIVAECMGGCACATCHVYVEPEWRDRLPAPASDEADMLAFATAPGPGSRLSCQIRLTAALDGLTVRMPERQG